MLIIKIAEKVDYDDWCRVYTMYLDFYATNLSHEQLMFIISYQVKLSG